MSRLFSSSSTTSKVAGRPAAVPRGASSEATVSAGVGAARGAHLGGGTLTEEPSKGVSGTWSTSDCSRRAAFDTRFRSSMNVLWPARARSSWTSSL